MSCIRSWNTDRKDPSNAPEDEKKNRELKIVLNNSGIFPSIICFSPVEFENPVSRIKTGVKLNSGTRSRIKFVH
jgi:hypothetical protein